MKIETIDISGKRHPNTKYDFSVLKEPVTKNGKTLYSSFLVEGVGDGFRTTVCVWASRQRKSGNKVRLTCNNEYNEEGKRIGIRVIRIN